jgi:hypothetical protein
MLLGRPWLIDVKVTHDWDNNVIIVLGNGIVKTILVNKKLGAKTRRPQVVVCYDLMEGSTNEEEDLILEIEPELFLITPITLSKKIVLLLNVGVFEIKSIEEFDPKQKTLNQI